MRNGFAINQYSRGRYGAVRQEPEQGSRAISEEGPVGFFRRPRKCAVAPQPARHAVKEYLATLDDTAWGAASDVVPKFVSPSDPAAQWTGAHKGPAFFAYSDNHLIVKFGVIVDVEASRAIRQAEVGAAKTMIERTEERFGLKPERLVGDTAYGAAPMLNWLVEEKGIAPHIPVFDKIEAG